MTHPTREDLEALALLLERVLDPVDCTPRMYAEHALKKVRALLLAARPEPQAYGLATLSSIRIYPNPAVADGEMHVSPRDYDRMKAPTEAPPASDTEEE